jgi:hypothetical protein
MMFEMSEEAEKKMNEDPIEAANAVEEDLKRGVGCSFCGKHQKTVRTMIAGPDVYICNECVELCNEIILEQRQERMKTAAENALTTANKTLRTLVKEERMRIKTPPYLLESHIIFKGDTRVAVIALQGLGALDLKDKDCGRPTWGEYKPPLEDAPSNEEDRV